MARTVHLPQHPLYRSPINQSQNLIQRPATLLHQAVCKTLLSSLLAHRSHLALTKLNHIPAKTTSQFCKALKKEFPSPLWGGAGVGCNLRNGPTLSSLRSDIPPHKGEGKRHPDGRISGKRCFTFA